MSLLFIGFVVSCRLSVVFLLSSVYRGVEFESLFTFEWVGSIPRCYFL